jgi:hypothetical protein
MRAFFLTIYLYTTSYILFNQFKPIWTTVIRKIKYIKQNKKKRLELFKNLSLMLAMFFLPLGYDALFKLIMDLTGSYWAADAVFYSISGCFWLSYILLSRYSRTKYNN